MTDLLDTLPVVPHRGPGWYTVAEISKVMGVSVSKGTRMVNEKVQKGEWEVVEATVGSHRCKIYRLRPK